MVFNFQKFRYDISEILDITDDILVVTEYRIFINTYQEIHHKEIYNWLSTLMPKQLTQLRLKFVPRNNGYYSGFYVMLSRPKNYYGNDNCILYKDDFYEPPRYFNYR